MKKIKDFVGRFISPELPIRLCIFNMMSAIGILGGLVSIITTYIMNIVNGQVAVIGIAMLLMVFLLYLANYRKKLKLASILLCGLIGFLLFPVIFLRGGGIYSGMPLWFLMVIVFEVILIEGKVKYVMSIATVALYCGLFAYAYTFPESLHYFASEKEVFMDVAQSFVFVSVCIVCIIAFQMYMYQRTLDRAEIANKEAEKAKKEAEAANATKSTFLANMSHEIRTPMGVIIGMNEMIQRESNQEGVLEYSKDISAAARSLLSIINDILDFSKIESGKMNIVEVEYSPAQLIRDINDIAKIKMEEKGLSFDMSIDPHIPNVLFGDDLRIKQCLINLISNAFKYTEDGGVVFEVTCDYRGDTAIMTYSISDTGSGIKEEELDKLFESFVRLDERKNRSIQGTGLGLNITNRLLELMGSKLEVKSIYGEGSRFYFTIRQKVVAKTALQTELPKPKQVGNEVKVVAQEPQRSAQVTSSPGAQAVQTAPDTVFTAPDAHVLVVDDNAMNLKVFCGLLKRTKIQVDTADGGMKAIEMVRKNRYDLIFLDNMMPVMSGEETLEAMRQQSLIGDTPVVMVTADALVGMREHFLEVGFDEYLSKPIELKKLEGVLRFYLEK